MSSWLDTVYNTANYFFIIALIPTITHSVAWIFAYTFKTGHFFVLNGEVSLLMTLLFSILSQSDFNNLSWRKLLINACVIIWDVRLGAFCFIRMIIRGSDFRFEEIKHSASFYLFSHIAQSLWIWLICLCLWIFNIKDKQLSVDIPLSFMDYIGLLTFFIGFLIEIIADEQKWTFKSKNDTKTEWIRSGLWAYCRHPNYFGEMLLWFGICIMCTSQNNMDTFSVLMCWISPFWGAFFLITTSLSMLERLADKRYGTNKQYWIYKRTVPVLVPFVC